MQTGDGAAAAAAGAARQRERVLRERAVRAVRTLEPIDARRLHTLVFSSGSLKGLAYVGLMRRLREHGVRMREWGVRRLVGTSIGALFAFVLALDLRADALLDIFNATGDIELSLLNLARLRALNDMKTIQFAVRKMLLVATGKTSMTLEEFRETTGYNIVVACTLVDQGRVVHVCADTHPRRDVVTAVVDSMRVPGFFPMRRCAADGGIYDGALLDPFPLSVCPVDERDGVLGFCLWDALPTAEATAETAPKVQTVDEPEDVIHGRSALVQRAATSYVSAVAQFTNTMRLIMSRVHYTVNADHMRFFEARTVNIAADVPSLTFSVARGVQDDLVMTGACVADALVAHLVCSGVPPSPSSAAPASASTAGVELKSSHLVWVSRCTDLGSGWLLTPVLSSRQSLMLHAVSFVRCPPRHAGGAVCDGDGDSDGETPRQRPVLHAVEVVEMDAAAETVRPPHVVSHARPLRASRTSMRMQRVVARLARLAVHILPVAPADALLVLHVGRAA